MTFSKSSRFHHMYSVHVVTVCWAPKVKGFFHNWQKCCHLFVTQTYALIFYLLFLVLSFMEHNGNFFSGFLKCLLQSSLLFQFILKILKTFVLISSVACFRYGTGTSERTVLVDVALETIYFYKLLTFRNWVYLFTVLFLLHKA